MRFIVFTATVFAVPTWASDITPSNADSPETKYKSAFAEYRGFRDEPVGSWRESNDRMQRLGGHMGHLSDRKPQASQSDSTQDKSSSGGR
jgi:hypothetical protein